MQKCSVCCKWKSDDEMGSRIVRGQPKVYKTCPPCREDAKNRFDVEAQREKRSTDAGKAKMREQNLSKSHKASVVYARKHSDAFKKSHQKYLKSDACKANRIRDAIRRKTDPSKRLSTSLGYAMRGLIKGNKTSSVMANHTSFKTGREVRQFWESKGVELYNHGTAWHVDHKIGVVWYDHTDPVEVKKCWHKDNLQTLTMKANGEKSFTIDHALVTSMPVALYPKQWHGVVPVGYALDALYKEMQGWSRFKAYQIVLGC